MSRLDKDVEYYFYNFYLQLGIVDVFNENADLSGLVETHENVRVSKIVHKAFFTIDEDGTERGAGTGG